MTFPLTPWPCVHPLTQITYTFTTVYTLPTSFAIVDVARFAEAFGAEGLRIETPDQISLTTPYTGTSIEVHLLNKFIAI
jgi:hypothetical protein